MSNSALRTDALACHAAALVAVDPHALVAGCLARDGSALVLRDRQEIAVVFGDTDAFGSVPSTYRKRWPVGCGGPGEPACIS